jgi:hypothetical protein
VIGFDAVLLDPHIQHECTAGHLLAVAAVAGVHDQRRRSQAIPHRAADASPFQIHLHPPCYTPNQAWLLSLFLAARKQPAPMPRTSENLDFCRPVQPNNSKHAGCFSLLPGCIFFTVLSLRAASPVILKFPLSHLTAVSEEP